MTSQGTIKLPSTRHPLLKSQKQDPSSSILHPRSPKSHPQNPETNQNASVSFIGTATTFLEWENIRLLTDPNFLHAGDHVHLGPGVTAERRTNPAVELAELPPLDGILLSHYHEDHFDKMVEDALNRDFLIVTTPHARGCLTEKEEPFRNVTALDVYESIELVNEQQEARSQGTPMIKVTGLPGKHVPPGLLSKANDLLGAVPPTNGWLLELSYQGSETGYRIYISGDTLLVDEVKGIRQWLKEERIDLMLVHLGGTTIPGPSMPLLMVTMDAKQGVEMMQLMHPDVTIPIHYDDYDVFMSPLEDFKTSVKDAGLQDRVVYLDRGEQYRFTVKA